METQPIDLSAGFVPKSSSASSANSTAPSDSSTEGIDLSAGFVPKSSAQPAATAAPAATPAAAPAQPPTLGATIPPTMNARRGGTQAVNIPPPTLQARRGGTQAVPETLTAPETPKPETYAYPEAIQGHEVNYPDPVKVAASLPPQKPVDTSLTAALARGKAGPPEAFAPIAKAIGETPMLPVGQFVREQVAKAPPIPDSGAINNILAALEDAGIVAGDVIQGLTTPSNITLLTAMAAVPEQRVFQIARGLVDAGFSVQMANQAAHDLSDGYEAYKHGDAREARRRWGSGAVTTAFAVLSGKSAQENINAGIRPSKEVSGPSSQAGETAEATAQAEVQPQEQATQPAPAEAAPQPSTDATTGDLVEQKKPSRIQQARGVDQVRKGKKVAVTTDKKLTNEDGLQSVKLDDGRHVYFDPKKTNPEIINEHASRGELYKLTGETPPSARTQEARSELSPQAVPLSEAEHTGESGTQPIDLSAGFVPKEGKEDAANAEMQAGSRPPVAKPDIEAPTVKPSVTGSTEAFQSAKGAVSDSFIDGTWDRIREGESIPFSDKPGTVENRIQAARDAGSIKTRADVERIVKAEAVRGRTPTQPEASATIQAKKEVPPKVEAAPLHKNASTQINLPEEAAAKVLQVGKHVIPDSDLAQVEGSDSSAAKGREGEPHITVKYGVDEDKADKLREALANHLPFEATLGKIKTFPPTENSDGAAVVHAEVKSPELGKLHKVIHEAAGNKEDDFEYKPHVTLAYVKPEVAHKYHGRGDLEGTKIPVDSITLSQRDGKQVDIPLGERKIEQEAGRAEARTARTTEEVPSVPPLASEGGNARPAIPSAGERPAAKGREIPASDRPENRELLERPSGRAGRRSATERSGGNSPAEHPAAERERGSTREPRATGADGKPVEAPTPEPAEQAQQTARELRNQRNFRITEEHAEKIGSGGEITKIKGNLDALETLKDIQREGREVATDEERATLAKYVDFGGLVSMLQRPWAPEYRAHYERFAKLLTPEEIQEVKDTTINTHHTSLPVVDWMWKAMQRMGFKGGRILEPGMGIGNFFGRIPKPISDRSELFGVEKNPLTGAMARLIYPDAKIAVKPFQQFLVPDNSLDAVIGNVPFSEVKVTDDPAYKDPKMSLHNYFIVKSLDKLRLGGVAALITSRYSLDGEKASARAAREEMAKRADLVAAIRLPDSAFKKHAGTEVVTDMLIFQKRDPGVQLEGTPAWVDTEHIKIGEHTYPLNKYFQEHPEMVLGEHSSAGSMYGPGQYTVKGPKDLDAALKDVMQRLPEKIYGKSKIQAAETAPSTMDPMELAPDNVKPGAFFKDENGKVWVKEAGAKVELPQELRSPEKIAHIKAAVGLRDSLNRAIETQLSTADDARVKASQEELGRLYDAYTKKYGDLHGPKLAKVFGSDPEYPKLLALENLNSETKTVSKAKIFTERVLAPYEPLRDLPDNPKAAMLKVMASKGYLDTKFMADLLKKPHEEVVANLEKEGLIYQDPQSGNYHTSDDYLSGNVREKLKQAQAAAEVDPRYERNVEELKKVQPKPLTIHEILPNLGQTWIPTDIYGAFVRHLAGGSRGGSVDITRDATGKWKVGLGGGVNRFDLDHKWGAGGVPGHKLVEYALNQQTPTVWKNYSDGTREVNQEATVAAREKLSAIKEEFKTVLRKARPEIQERLETIYNDNFNGHRLREYSGEHLDFPGMAKEWADKIRGYQKAAVWRNVQEGRALLAHDVGLGKTLTMAASGMELKRLGMSRKNMYTVPNHMVNQWREDFKRFYPNANVLAVTDDDFTAANRGKLMSRIATGDWDAVIIPHSQFDLLPMSPEWESNTINKRLADYRQVLEDLDPQDDRRTIKQIEKSVDKLESRLQELNQKKKDNVIPFDQLGVDQLFVDEAHAYKAMAVPSRMGQVAGISNRASQRALALEMKTDFLRETHKGRGTVFATGTPITNTMGELYVMTKYLAPDMLEAQGIRSFDDWSANYAQTVTNFEYSPDGVTFRPKTSLSEFVNVPELSTMVRRFGDFLSKAHAKLKEPTAARKDVTVKITPTQEPLLEQIAARGEALRGPMSERPDPSEDNWLKLSSDARKMSLDPRLYDPSLADEKDSKANRAVKIVKDVLDRSKADKGTVTVFSDFFQHQTPDGKPDFNLFEDMRDKLVKEGVPRDQIAIIHEFKSKDAKEELFSKVRSGKVRVLFGSTDKMGIGTNIQDRLKALLHLDQPWRPDQVSQREGRIIRSGNMHDDVEIYRFIAEPEQGKVKTFDPKTGQMVEKDRPRAYDLQMYQQLARKAHFIEQFLSGNVNERTMEDAAGDVKLNSQMFELAKAMATGNPDAMRKIKVEHDLRTYSMLERNWQVERSRNSRQLDQHELMVPALEYRIKEFTDAANKWAQADDGKNLNVQFGDRTFTDKDELKKWLDANPSIEDVLTKPVKLWGIDIPLDRRWDETRKQASIQYKLAGEWHDVPRGDEAIPTVRALLGSVAARARGLSSKLNEAKALLDDSQNKLAKLKAELAEPSPYREKVQGMEKEIAEINQRLGMTKAAAEDEIGDPNAGQTAGDEEEVEQDPDDQNNSGEAGFAHMESLPTVLPFVMAAEGVKRVNRIFNQMSEGMGDLLTRGGLGRTRPEIRRYDEDLADNMTRLDTAYQYHTEKAKAIVKNIVGDLSREEEKGFVLLADQATREWMRQNRLAEFLDHMLNPKITDALARYKPFEQNLREAVQELGGKTIDEDYLHRVYEQHTSGINKPAAKGEGKHSSFDDLVSPQIDRMKGRVQGADYYYEKGLHEFGPSFATRWVSVMTKLEENRTAADFMAKATKLGPFSEKQKKEMIEAGKDPARPPDYIYYNGKQFFSPEMAKLVRESRSGTPAAKRLADQLGITELPRTKEVREYGIYEPLKGKRLENSAAALMEAVIKDADSRQLTGRAMQVARSLNTRYAGPREITDALTHSRPDLIPSATAWLGRKIAPATNLLRQQIIGLGFMVHYANVMRRVAQTAPGGVANPLGWVRAINVAFSKELKARGISGTEDPGFDRLLGNGGISPHGLEEYKRYVELNTDPKQWFGITNMFRERGEAGGRVKLGSIVSAPWKLAAEATRPISHFGHEVLFGPGGIDQRSRLWLHDFLREKDPSLSDAEIAHLVNERLGRYNRATWTKLQREVAPYMLFPGWDFSSMAYVLQHPIRTALPPAVVIWAANRILNATGANQEEDKNDPFALHVGQTSISTNLLRESLAMRVAGAPLRAARELAAGHGAGEAAGEAVSGMPGDLAGLGVNLAHPYVQAPLKLMFNRERAGGGDEIIQRGDSGRRALGFRGGQAVKDIAEFAGKEMMPIYGRYSDDRGGLTPETLLSNVGVNMYEKKPRRRTLHSSYQRSR
jgi:N12 class adenine-specific DNA methylase/2'-5' RNA ligase